MKEIAETLKSLGPKYELIWRMEYYGNDKSMIMTLIYKDPDLNFTIQYQECIPFDVIEHLDKYGSQFLKNMSLKINDELHQVWAKF